MKKALIVVGIVVVLGVINIFFRPGYQNKADLVSNQNGMDVKSLSFIVKGELFELKDGKARREFTAGTNVLDTLSIFGEPVYGDLDDDNDKDAAVLLVRDQGAYGKSYYAGLAIKSGFTFRSTQTMLIGKDIAPQTVEIREGRAVYNFAERKAGEPVSVRPSIGRSVWVHYDKENNAIGEWVKDFEGESNLPPDPQ